MSEKSSPASSRRWVRLLILGLFISPKKLPTDLLTFRDDKSKVFVWAFSTYLGCWLTIVSSLFSFPYFFIFRSTCKRSLGIVCLAVTSGDSLALSTLFLFVSSPFFPQISLYLLSSYLVTSRSEVSF